MPQRRDRLVQVIERDRTNAIGQRIRLLTYMDHVQTVQAEIRQRDPRGLGERNVIV